MTVKSKQAIIISGPTAVQQPVFDFDEYYEWSTSSADSKAKETKLQDRFARLEARMPELELAGAGVPW
jgi:hypothetical protein